MTSRPRLLLVAHGTRSQAGQHLIRKFRDRIAERLIDVPVVLSWVDLLQPRPEQVLVDGVPTVIVPCFLAAGFHVRTDVHDAAASAPGPVVATPHFGDADEVREALCMRLAEVSNVRADAAILAAAGSSDERSLAETRRVADRLSRRAGIPVQAAFATAASPTLNEAVEQLRREGHNTIAVYTHLFAPGLFYDRVASCGADIIANPLGLAPQLGDLVVRRYVEGVANLSV